MNNLLVILTIIDFIKLLKEFKVHICYLVLGTERKRKTPEENIFKGFVILALQTFYASSGINFFDRNVFLKVQ